MTLQIFSNLNWFYDSNRPAEMTSEIHLSIWVFAPSFPLWTHLNIWVKICKLFKYVSPDLQVAVVSVNILQWRIQLDHPSSFVQVSPEMPEFPIGTKNTQKGGNGRTDPWFVMYLCISVVYCMSTNNLDFIPENMYTFPNFSNSMSLTVNDAAVSPSCW